MSQYSRIPTRAGSKPATTPRTPHMQLDQTSPLALQEALWQRMSALPGVVTGPSGISVPGTRAISLRTGGHDGAFMVGREFAHLHPAHDGSLHMTLDPQTHALALAGGWAEPHPLAGRFAPATTALVYGPRAPEELEMVWWLVQQSYRYASGQDTRTPYPGLAH